MFSKVFVEKDITSHPRTLSILSKLSKPNVTYIDKVEDVFGRVYKPYLQKRSELNLFIGEKKGQLIKPAPAAYGLSGSPHYYFIHAYNCVYECQYCYLQGYFNSPDIVLFVNHEDICREITELCQSKHASEKEVWFHAGEFSDSLALSGLTEEWPLYWDTFASLPNAFLELRTKSHNIRSIVDLNPLPNVVVSFSLAPEPATKEFDLKTPPLAARLKAIKKLSDKGHTIGLHLDPVVYDDKYLEKYEQLIDQIMSVTSDSRIKYVSLGVVRFTKKVYQCVQKNYPESSLHAGEFVSSFDDKVRYPRPMRLQILKNLQALVVSKGTAREKVYLCMEDLN